MKAGFVKANCFAFTRLNAMSCANGRDAGEQKREATDRNRIEG